MNKALLLKPHLPEADVELPGVGSVRVRGLSRAEALAMKTVDGDEIEITMLVLGMVDPPMTAEDVLAWRAASPPREIETVAEKISELSGMTEAVANEAVKDLVTDPDAQFRDAASGEAGDDGSPATGGDVG